MLRGGRTVADARWYEEIFDAIDEGLCICQAILDGEGQPRDYRFLEINDRFAREAGLHDAVGKTALELVPGLEGHWIDIYGKVALTRQPVRFEQASATMGRWFSVYAFPVGNPADLTFGVLFKDITATRQSEARARRVFEGVAMSIWDEDFREVKAAIDRLRAEGVVDFREYLDVHPEFVEWAIRAVRINDVNPASVRFFGATSRDDLIRSLDNIFVEETRAVFVEELIAIAEGRRVFESETVLKTLAGERRDVLFTITFPPPDDSFDRVFVSLTDITARKVAEESLRASERRFREMADNAPVMIWVTDESGHCTFLSRSWYEFTGQTPATGLGLGWLQAVHPDDRETSAAIFRDAVERRAPFRLDYRLRQADGKYRWAIDSAAPFIAGGHFRGYIGSVIDITERKAAEDALRRSAEALREADRLKDDFLSTLSHELRPPLTAILGWAQMIEARGLSQEEVQTGIAAIVRSAQAQFALIEDVLDISRITTGRMRLERRPSELRTVIDAAVDTVRPAAEAKRIALVTEFDPALGSIEADPERLQQVIWNLLSNAIKFTPPGGRVTIVGSRREHEVVIEVIDTGIGIAPDFLPHVFERFRQADSSSHRSHGGLGLGLALSKDLVELHGGRITAQSQEGRGSRFVVALPV
jgi:PAS domain S-box-containing protein